MSSAFELADVLVVLSRNREYFIISATYMLLPPRLRRPIIWSRLHSDENIDDFVPVYCVAAWKIPHKSVEDLLASTRLKKETLA